MEDNRPRVKGDIVEPSGCYQRQEHLLTYNQYNYAIQCARCGELFIRYLIETEPGVWVRDENADPEKQ